MADNSTALALPEAFELGPAMQRLSPRRRRFVLALLNEVPPGIGAAVAAGEIAGYSETYSRQLVHDTHVQLAIEEVTRQRVYLDAPLALKTIREIMGDKFSKDKLRAATTVLDRIMPAKQEIKIEATTSDPTKNALAHLQHLISLGVGRDALVREFGEFGLEYYEGLLGKEKPATAQIIEGEFEVVEPVVQEADDDESEEDW